MQKWEQEFQENSEVFLRKHREKEIEMQRRSVAFAKFIDEECTRSIGGWFVKTDPKVKNTEYDLNSLYDYWINIDDPIYHPTDIQSPFESMDGDWDVPE